MNGNEDSLQPVKYLGKARSLYAHGMGVAIVRKFFFFFLLFDFFYFIFDFKRNQYVLFGIDQKKVHDIIVVLYQFIHLVYLFMKK
jgi:hypothetical protein